MSSILRKHAVAFWLLAAVLVALVLPEPGAKGGILRPEFTTKLGIWLIFFLQGLALPTDELTRGYRPKRLHAFVLGWNFLLFPVVAAALVLPLSVFLQRDLVLGFWLLAFLPTTISSAVVFSTISGGSTPNAIFATVLSNLFAIFYVPLVSLAYLTRGELLSVPLGPLLGKLVLLIIVPLILGQALRCLLPRAGAVLGKRTRGLGTGIVIFIVYVSFADSVESGFLGMLPTGDIVLTLGATVLLLLLVSAVVWWSSSWTGLNHAQRISAFFCASQKSLATGLPIAGSILVAIPGVADGAAVLTPLLCYHLAQLFLAGIVSGRAAA